MLLAEPALHGEVVTELSLLTWLRESFKDDETARAAAGWALIELSVIYAFIALGFVALWVTWRSTARIRRLREEMGIVLRQQKTKEFEPQDFAKMYGMF